MFQAGSVKVAVAALCLAWTRHLLKLAIADITARSDRDWQAAELDRTEMLAGLTALHDAAQNYAFRRDRLETRQIIGCS